MAIDERQTDGIREGAGREESRYNLEFIDFLQKWGTPILMVAAAISAGMVGWRYYQEKKTEHLDNAFVEYEAASGDNASPEALIAVAEQYHKVKSVSLMARLDAADAYLQSVRSGAKPGARFNADGTLETPEDAMAQEDREAFLTKADQQFETVLAESINDGDRQWFAVGALFGIAAVDECREKFDDAKATYERIVKLAAGTPLDLQAKLAQERLATVDLLKAMPPLLSRAELPKPPAPPAPETPTIELNKDGAVGPFVPTDPTPEAEAPKADPAEAKPGDPAPTTPK